MRRFYLALLCALVNLFAISAVAQIQKPVVKTPVDTSTVKNAKALVKEKTQGVQLPKRDGMVKPLAPGSSVEYTFLYMPSGSSSVFNGQPNLQGVNLVNKMSLSQLPFSMEMKGNNGYDVFNRANISDFYKMSFDHKKYMAAAEEAAGKKNVINKEMISGAIERLKGVYEDSLRNEIKTLQRDSLSTYGSSLHLPEGVTDLSRTDIEGQLLSDTATSAYRQNMDRLQELLKTRDADALANDPSYHTLRHKVEHYETLQKVYGMRARMKQRFENNKIVENAKHELASLQESSEKAKDRARAIRSQSNLNGLQRLFLNITKLDIGQFGVQSGAYSVQDLVNTGARAEWMNSITGVEAIYGKNNNANSWLQSGLYSPLTNEYARLMGLTLKSGTSSAVEQSLTVNLFDFKDLSTNRDQEALTTGYLPSLKRKDVVVSYHIGFSPVRGHKISADLSRSFGAITGSQRADSSQYRTYGDVVSAGGTSGYAGGVEYSGEVGRNQVKAYVRKSGLGYSNPGNIYLRRGETQYGTVISRSFYNRKLTATYSVDYRLQHFDPAKRYQYRALNNRLKLGYRINRDSRVGLTLQRINNQATLAVQPSAEHVAEQSSAGVTSRVQLDGGYRVRAWEKKIVNTAIVSRQQMEVPVIGGAAYRNKMLLFSHTSALLLDKNVLSLALMATHSDNHSYYFNTSMFMLETDYAYALTQGLRMSSGVGYYDNVGWNKQLGVKQQISTALLSGKLYVDLQITGKKAVKITRTELADQFYISVSLRYNFIK